MEPNVSFSSTTNMLAVKDGQVLLVKRSDDLKDFPGWYILPGGKQEKDETPLEAAVRETLEETGIAVKSASLKVLATHYHEYKSKVYLVNIFTAKEFEGELKASSEGVPQWMPIDQAMNEPKLYPDLKRHIKLIMDANTPEVIFTYHKFNQELQITERR